jgi:hypothetical protein
MGRFIKAKQGGSWARIDQSSRILFCCSSSVPRARGALLIARNFANPSWQRRGKWASILSESIKVKKKRASPAAAAAASYLTIPLNPPQVCTHTYMKHRPLLRIKFLSSGAHSFFLSFFLSSGPIMPFPPRSRHFSRAESIVCDLDGNEGSCHLFWIMNLAPSFFRRISFRNAHCFNLFSFIWLFIPCRHTVNIILQKGKHKREMKCVVGVSAGALLRLYECVH